MPPEGRPRDSATAPGRSAGAVETPITSTPAGTLASKLSIGIVGLPNVGKSTLFRALTSVSVPAENYPFCTIGPNVGVVEVPDLRLDRLAEVVQPEEVKPAVVEFVDIAGLVEGASRGEGLGNKFLQNIREVDALALMLRCFEDDRVARAGGAADPLEEAEIVHTELALSDLELVSGRRERVERTARSGDEDARDELALLERVEAQLERGQPVRRLEMDEEGRAVLRSFNLLTLKPVVYVPNVGSEALEGEEPEGVERVRGWVEKHDPGAEVVPVSAQLEAEAAEFPKEERRELLRAHGLERSGLDRLIRAGYRLLGLQTFFSWNEEELRAWTVHRGARAPEAAGRVHTDFQEGFIRAEAIGWEEFLRVGSMREAREQGAVRSEGKDYRVRDGDILFFHADR